MHAERNIVLANPSVCPSVYLSVTLWCSILKNAHEIVKLFSHSGMGMTLVVSERYRLGR